MGNMSYCRFQNTLHDFNDCVQGLAESYEGIDEPLSCDELDAAKQLACKALEWIKELASVAGRDLDDLRDEDLESAIQMINDESAIQAEANRNE